MAKPVVFMAIAVLGTAGSPLAGEPHPGPDQGKSGESSVLSTLPASLATPEQAAEIRKLIEDFLITEKEARTNAEEETRRKKAEEDAEREAEANPDPLFGVKKPPQFADEPPPEVLEEMRGYQKIRDDAFDKLTEFKDLAFPLLVAHLDDERASLKWWNHSSVKTVGGMCYRVIHDQLTKKPGGYSEYGYQRTGRDGESHVKPYWDGTPYDESDGLENWLKQNQNLSHTELRIKCLTWMLNEEKKIGVIDPHGYYVNILPLELGILELRDQAGQDVADELARVRKLMETKPGTQVPRELMPDKALPEVEKDHSLQETAAMLKVCPDGHANLKDIPILYGTFPLLNKNPADWNEQDQALAKRRDAGEVILGGEPDDARDPRFKSICQTCGYQYEVTEAPGTGSNWLKTGKKFTDFTTPFFPAAVSLPFAGLADAGISVEINRKGKVVSETIEISIPADKKSEMMEKIEQWIDKNKFQRGVLHIDTPRYPRQYEERVENDDAWFFIDVQTETKRNRVRFSFILERFGS